MQQGATRVSSISVSVSRSLRRRLRGLALGPLAPACAAPPLSRHTWRQSAAARLPGGGRLLRWLLRRQVCQLLCRPFCRSASCPAGYSAGCSATCSQAAVPAAAQRRQGGNSFFTPSRVHPAALHSDRRLGRTQLLPLLSRCARNPLAAATAGRLTPLRKAKATLSQLPLVSASSNAGQHGRQVRFRQR